MSMGNHLRPELQLIAYRLAPYCHYCGISAAEWFVKSLRERGHGDYIGLAHDIAQSIWETYTPKPYESMNHPMLLSMSCQHCNDNQGVRRTSEFVRQDIDIINAYRVKIGRPETTAAAILDDIANFRRAFTPLVKARGKNSLRRRYKAAIEASNTYLSLLKVQISSEKDVKWPSWAVEIARQQAEQASKDSRKGWENR